MRQAQKSENKGNEGRRYTCNVIEVIGVPFDLCGKRLGSRLGPAALRLAGIRETLGALGIPVIDTGDVPVDLEIRASDGMRNFEPLMTCIRELKTLTRDAITRGAIPLILGGEHDLSIGSVSGALEVHDGDLALLWIDAHADANTPGTSPTKNLHGMPVAALQGLPSGVGGVMSSEWSRILEEIVPATRLMPEMCAWYGLRDVDFGERELIRKTPGDLAITMHDIDRRGVVQTMAEFDRWLRNSGATQLWISFDVDVLDPILAPGTGTTVTGGLSYREGHLMAEMLREFLDAPDCPYALAGVDVVETNPLFDTHNETAKMAVEWVGSLFGKTIMGTQ
jgi:arginase